MSLWVNIDQHHGVPSQPRKDVLPPPHWRLDAIASLGRPHHLAAHGEGVAFVLDSGDASDIWALDEAGLRRLTTNRDPHAFWDDTAPAWSPDRGRLAYVEDGVIHVVAASGGPPRRLVAGGSPLWLDDENLLISIERDRVARLCRASIADPWPVAITPEDGSAGGPALSPDGQRVAYVHVPRHDRHRSDLRMVDLPTGTVTTLVSAQDHLATGPAFSPDGGSLVFASDLSGWSELYLLSGTSVRRLTSDQANFSTPRWSADGLRILAVRTRAGVGDLVLVDAGTGEVETLAGGGTWSAPHWAQDGGVVALYEDHRTPPRIMVVEPAGATRQTFAQVPASIAAAPHVTPMAVTYSSTDGMEIPGFLFRPAAAGRGRCPAVVYAHGGPTSHYADEWDGPAQFFLDKGYAWFAVNFRGSNGYGREFRQSGHGDWGVGDTDDCLAAHDYLAGLDWIDPDRIAIFGASYGSYLAVSALARDPRHRFACGVAKYGDSDILTSWAQGDRVGSEDLERMMSHPSENRDGYRQGSPIHRVADIERPLLVAHGERDLRVSLEQSRQLVDALAAADKTFEFITYPTEAHGLLRRGPQIHFYERLERFLDWYLM